MAQACAWSWPPRKAQLRRLWSEMLASEASRYDCSHSSHVSTSRSQSRTQSRHVTQLFRDVRQTGSKPTRVRVEEPTDATVAKAPKTIDD
eukprot:4727013-Amphidinium_carterae.2